MAGEEVERVVCASYTHARRHPMVLGRIAGWTPPFQVSVTQLGVLVGSFLTLHWLRPLWGAVVPGGSALVLLGLPCLLTWMVRRVRLEGRSLPRAGMGWVQLWSTPTTGKAGGQPVREARAGRPGQPWVFVAEGDEG